MLLRTGAVRFRARAKKTGRRARRSGPGSTDQDGGVLHLLTGPITAQRSALTCSHDLLSAAAHLLFETWMRSFRPRFITRRRPHGPLGAPSQETFVQRRLFQTSPWTHFKAF